MTTYIPFTPSNVSAPRLTLQLDYQDITMIVTWNVAAQRYYINLFTVDGVWICTIPLVETSPGQPVLSMVYDSQQGALIGKMSNPIYRPPGQIVQYTLEDFTPDTINGLQQCLTLTDQRFQFDALNPGVITVMGHASRYENMAAGYFTLSTLIYRNGQFETNP